MRMTIAPVKLQKNNVVQVSRDDGFQVATYNADAPVENIAECFIDLPKQRVEQLDLETQREAQAVIYARESLVDSFFPESPKVIVFLHGFSQRPRNYASTLRFLAANGNIVIAPRVWLFDTAFANIEGAKLEGKWFASQPAKLQTALLIDTIRCVKWAVDNLSARNVTLLGHSMGGAMALVAAQALGNLASSVAALAPAVGPTEITPVNKYLSVNDGDIKQFASLFENIPVVFAHGENDGIVKQRDVNQLFDAFDNADRPDIVGDVDIVNGTHVGFEDTLDVDLPILKRIDWLFFKLIDFIVFGLFDLLSQGKEQQLEYTKQLLLAWLESTTVASPTLADIKSKIQAVDQSGEFANIRWGS